ncbi:MULTISPECIES: DUF3592 domain-containing protein [Acinetobacter]|uniref:DUF3592 domain-containing protein n=1 Tax=Acinetobacter TaxID=469 RepID=UPI000CF2FE18|nr:MULTISPECIES: DUF3592 domain-containing protein [Acinetobacter]AVH49037.1 hypothetical protein C3Y93_05020 [Acinetobacter sp. SWBY1]MDM1283791.1 hypothetical protein [Acinetobacter towneri]MDM1720592.1 hypothetical protein [Acinetobacter towneri]
MISLVFFLVGMGTLFLAWVLYQQSQYFKSNVIEVQGRIVDIQIRKFSSSKTQRIVHRPIIHYVFQGKTWQYEAEYDVRQYNQNTDAFVRLHFKPEHPSLVRSEPDLRDGHILIFICLGLGLLFNGLGLHLIIDNFNDIKISLLDEKFFIGMGVIAIVMFFTLFWQRENLLWMFNLPNATKKWGLTDNAICLEQGSDHSI